MHSKDKVESYNASRLSDINLHSENFFIPVYKNQKSVKEFFRGYLVAFPDYRIDDIKCLADSEWAMVWGKCSGTWRGDFMKQKANGKNFMIHDADLFRFNANGKMIEHYNIQPFASTARQIGMKM